MRFPRDEGAELEVPRADAHAGEGAPVRGVRHQLLTGQEPQAAHAAAHRRQKPQVSLAVLSVIIECCKSLVSPAVIIS